MSIAITPNILDACPSLSSALTTTSNVSQYLISVTDIGITPNVDVTTANIVNLVENTKFTVQLSTFNYCSTY